MKPAALQFQYVPEEGLLFVLDMHGDIWCGRAKDAQRIKYAWELIDMDQILEFCDPMEDSDA